MCNHSLVQYACEFGARRCDRVNEHVGTLRGSRTVLRHMGASISTDPVVFSGCWVVSLRRILPDLREGGKKVGALGIEPTTSKYGGANLYL